LPENNADSSIIVPSKELGGAFATEIAVDAGDVHVKWSRDIAGVLFISISHIFGCGQVYPGIARELWNRGEIAENSLNPLQ
jgi:hypothetical protein